MNRNDQKYAVTNLLPADHPEIMRVWEASVRATHHFLAEEDIQLYRRLGSEKYLDAVRLYGVRDGALLGFLGVSDDGIEMLFIHPDSRGKGIGRTLLDYAVSVLGLRRVDANEQNDQAVGFYLHAGFTVIGRSETDSEGKPYPILHLELLKNEKL